MNEITSKNFILEVLLALNEKNIPATKIFLHKFVYFLTLQNYSKLFRFEPYTYGPFSFGLAQEVERLIFWDEVELEGKKIKLADDINRKADTCRLEVLSANIDIFMNLIGKSTSFDNLEKIGTILYCMEALKKQHMEISFENVKEEFKGWKGNKYPDSQIEEAYKKVSVKLPVALQ